MASQTPVAKRNRPVRACTACKQVKLRCDAKETFPQPCSRCVSRSLDCIVDATFRRTPARQRLDEITRELYTIKRSMNDGRENIQGSAASQSVSNWSSNDGEQFCASEEALDDIQDAQLGKCVLARCDIVTIFATFAVHYYQHLPIIEPSMSVGSIQKSNPFLFWTVVAIVIQRLPASYKEQWPALLEPYKDLLGRALLSSPLPLLTVQGLLYICSWPLPVEFQPRDLSWNLSGLALNAALYMGLHKAGHPTSLRSIGVFGDSPMRSITWLATFYVSTSLSHAVGVSAPLRAPEELTAVSNIISDYSIPREFAAIADLQRCLAKYTTLISESLDDSLASTLAQLCEQELGGTKTRFVSCWNPRVECIFLTARLYVCGLLAVTQLRHLGRGDEDLSTQSELLSHRAHLAQGLAVAIRDIEIICNTLPVTEPSHLFADRVPPQKDLYYGGLPKFYFRSLVFAAFYLLRFFAFGGWCSTGDRDLARNHVIMVHTYLKRSSADPLDESGRAAAAIDALCRGSTAGPTKGMAALKISDRLAASIAFDAVATSSELRNKPTQVKNDWDTPHQNLNLDSPPDATFPGIEPARRGEESQFTAAQDWEWNTDLPHYMMEGFDLEMLGLSDDFFADPRIIG